MRRSPFDDAKQAVPGYNYQAGDASGQEIQKKFINKKILTNTEWYNFLQNQQKEQNPELVKKILENADERKIMQNTNASIMNIVQAVDELAPDDSEICGDVLMTKAFKNLEALNKTNNSDIPPEIIIPNFNKEDPEHIALYNFVNSNPFLRENILHGILLKLANVRPNGDNYERLWNKNIYNLMSKKAPSSLAQYIVKNYASILTGTGLELGAGNARDSIYFLKKKPTAIEKIITLDSSPKAVETIQQNLSGKTSQVREKIEISSTDIVSQLEGMKKRGETVNFIYGLSVLHYFSTTKLKKIFELIKDCLAPGGHLIFSVKSPRSSFDKTGILFDYRVMNEKSPEDEHVTRKFASIGPDGILRYSRSNERMKHILNKVGLKQITSDEYNGEVNYEIDAQGEQLFQRFIFQKPLARAKSVAE